MRDSQGRARPRRRSASRQRQMLQLLDTVEDRGSRALSSECWTEDVQVRLLLLREVGLLQWLSLRRAMSFPSPSQLPAQRSGLADVVQPWWLAKVYEGRLQGTPTPDHT